jgi:hypothetical protein
MPPSIDLTALFQAGVAVLIQERDSLNQADDANHNHGDHMLEIFQLAVRAASEKRDSDLADAMLYASDQLRLLSDNGSAQVYARGLALLAEQFRSRQITLEELVPYVRAYLHPEQSEEKGRDQARSGEILKAMLSALADWEHAEAGKATDGGLDMGYLFGVGMAYLQAKQQGGDRLHILAETVVSASPLGRIPYRHRSGVLVISSLLQAMG